MTKGTKKPILFSLGSCVTELPDWDQALSLMDKEIKEKLLEKFNKKIANNQEFFDAYCLEHGKKYNENFGKFCCFVNLGF